MNPLEIKNTSNQLEISLKRDLIRDDFAPVTKVSNAVHFILFEDDWDVKEVEGQFVGELKISFKNREDLTKDLNKNKSWGELSPYVMDLVAVYKTKIEAETEDAVEEMKSAAEEKLYIQALDKVNEAILKINALNNLFDF